MKHRKVSDEDFAKLIENELESIIDWQLLILKGHILIEYSLNKYVEDCSSENFNIHNENFQFNQKIKLCKALKLFDGSKHSQLPELINSFNRLRNSIAHYLDYNEEELRKVISLYKEMSLSILPVDEKLSDIEIIKLTIQSICGLIIGIKMKQQKFRRFTLHIVQKYRHLNNDDISKEFDEFESY